jgi:uncharacterized LabA/DUF88 family protein
VVWDEKTAARRSFHLHGSDAVKTAVYVDGYNLYYGRLRQTPYKWLDVAALLDAIVRIQSPAASIEMIKYFSAPALARFASRGLDSVSAQERYHRALKTRHPHLQIILGTHSMDISGTLLPAFRPGLPYDKSDRHRVWKLEEKKTDVNIAIEMYRDAVRGGLDQMVIVSNDSDAEPVLAAIRQDCPTLTIGVVTPVPPRTGGAKGHRSVSSSLAKWAHWTRRHILDEELEHAQLPPRVPTRKKPIDKPPHW